MLGTPPPGFSNHMMQGNNPYGNSVQYQMPHGMMFDNNSMGGMGAANRGFHMQDPYVGFFVSLICRIAV